MSENGLDDWIITSDIAVIVNRLRVIREGLPGDLDPRPEVAMQVLRTFALRRPIEDLLRLQPETESTAQGFAPLDATAVLTLAALTRPVEEAATLAIEQWKMECAKNPARSPLTDSILHDVTAQRIVQEVAVFIGECRRKGPADLVAKALDAFVMTTSGRTSADKALLYIALREEQCADDAAELLKLTLLKTVEGPARAAPGSLGQIGIVGALRHFSPSETIVQDWIAQEMKVAERELAVVGLVAGLLVGEPDGTRELAEHIGRTWKPRRLIDLCEILAKESSACFTLVLDYAVARSDKDSLAELIQVWDRSEVLAATVKDLLAAIVAGGADSFSGPRPISFLENIYQTLKNDRASARSRKEFRVAAAAHVRGRTGAEVAELLGRVGRGELRRAAQIVNEQLTGRLLAGEIGAGDFVAYLNGLQRAAGISALLTFWALRELSDPTASDHALQGRAWVVGDIAARLCADGHTEIGFDLLERCLENEQWLNAADVADIVGQVRLPDERWYSLLSATVGRWAETRRRDDVVAALRDPSFNKEFDREAEAVIHSVQ
jgi:hypothetical protein